MGADDRIDRGRARAETYLDRIDDDDPAPAIVDMVASDEFGVHVHDPQGAAPEDAAAPSPVGGDVADAIDAVAEAFNARDLEAVLDALAEDAELPGVLGNDRENLPAALEGLWHRRPTSLLLRGEVDDEPVGVLWEHDGEAWWRIAAVHVGDVVDSTIGVLEVTEDPELVDQIDCEAPEADELDEGARWSEWDEGAAD